jgi:hypothetical protein
MNRDFISSLFWLLVSIVICIQSFHMGIGTARNPGTAYFGLLSGGMLGTLSLALFFKALFSKRRRTDQGPVSTRTYARGAFVVASLAVYAIVMPIVGYLITTFLLLTLLFWVFDPRKVSWLLSSMAFSLLATTASYCLFAMLLHCQFPTGYFGI